MLPPHLQLTVTHRDTLADGVVALTLARADGAPLPPWEPGAHVDLVLGDDLVRQYSLCSDPADLTAYRVAVLDEPGGRGGSAWVHRELHVGDAVKVGEPRNHFVLQDADGYVFVAGGIGITPIRAMIAEVERRGAAWRLLYCGRRREGMAFVDELAGFGDRVHLQCSTAAGRLDLADALGDAVPGTEVYACGPPALLAAVAEATSDWPEDSVHTERFDPLDDAAEPHAVFEVEFTLSGVTATIPPERSILDVAEEIGAPVFSSCREGTCGTCETAVLEGEIDHRDAVLTPRERAAGDAMMICVSRAAPGCPLLRLAL